MARTPRETTTTGSYHVMMRGINKQNIFLDTLDRIKFLQFLENSVNKTKSISGKDAGAYEIYAYALMSNHIHILVKVVSGNLGDLIKSVASSYVLYFNKKYNRDGHLFKERFKSEVCENDEYFETLLRYIHQNPIKAGLCTDLLQYKFTSWDEYINPEKSRFKICSTDKIIEKYPIEKMQILVYDILPANNTCLDMDKSHGQIPDSSIVKHLSDIYGFNNSTDILKVEKKLRKHVIVDLLDFGASISQINRLCGISKNTVSRMRDEMETERKHLSLSF